MYASQISADKVSDVIKNKGNITDFDAELAQVYGLHDPDTDERRYVGVTCDPQGRLDRHLTPSSIHKSSPLSLWLRSLVESGRRPNMEIIETVSMDRINACERRAIIEARAGGDDLLNVSPGGGYARRQTGITNRTGSSKYVGVSWHSRDQLWQVRIGIGGQSKYIGYFADEEEAARAYDATARRVFGEGARTNFQAEA